MLKSYKCKNLANRCWVGFVLLISLLFVILSGCGAERQINTVFEDQMNADIETGAEERAYEYAQERSFEIASLYKDIYADAEKTVSSQYFEETVISQETLDKIEDLLIAKGYPVMNSDGKYPSYLENAESLYEFWKSVCAGEKAAQEIIAVSQTGELYYTYLQYENSSKYQTYVAVGWDEDGDPTIVTSNYKEIVDWELTESDDFYYQLAYPSGAPFDRYDSVRLKPADKTLYDLTEKYLSPVGYLSNNMFISEWSYEDYGNLSFNDLFEFFYRIKNNRYLYPSDYESEQGPYYCSYIPAALFEETIKPYFDISLKEFRERCLYDSEKDAYPWQELCCDNVTYYPTVEPEVTAYKDNKDGTFTLTVNARCGDYKTDRLFTHEVTVRPLKNGGYQYLSNKITYKSGNEMPPDCPRLPQQRKAGLSS